MPHSRRWIGVFRLRSLMIGVLAIGVGCWEIERVRTQTRAVAVIKAAGGRVLYDYEVDAKGKEISHARSPVPERLLQWLGFNFFHNLVEVSVTEDILQGISGGLTERQMFAIGQLRSLQKLELSLWMYNGEHLAYLKTLGNLRSLSVRATQINDSQLVNLKALKTLEKLDLCHTPISDAGLAHLRSLTNLRTLELSLTNVGDAGLANLESLTKLENLDLERTAVRDAGLAHLVPLKHLRELSLSEDTVSDEGLRT